MVASYLYRIVFAWFLVFACAAALSIGAPSGFSGTLQIVEKASASKKLVGHGRTTATCLDGHRVFVAGSRITTGRNTVSVIFAFDAELRLLWRKEWPEEDANGVHAYAAIVASPDCSQVFVTGQTMDAEGLDDYVTMAYDGLNGLLLWQKTYGEPGRMDAALDIDLTPDGASVIVTGTSTGTSQSTGGINTNQDFATLAYDTSTGTERWVKRYDLGDFDKAASVEINPEGTRAYVAGYSVVPPGVRVFAVIAHNLETGEVVSEAHSPPWSGIAVAVAMAVSPDGTKVIVAGEAASGFAIFIHDVPSGNSMPLPRICPGSYCRATDIETSADGSVIFVTGFSKDANSPKDFFTIAVDISDVEAPSTLWRMRYDGAAQADAARDLEISKDGSIVFVAGTSIGRKGNSDGVLIAYDAHTGEQLASPARFDRSGNTDEFLQIAPGKGGQEVCVTGFSEKAGSEAPIPVLCYAYEAN